MGIFSVLTGIITQVAPKVLNVAKYAVNGIIDGVSKNGLAGYRLQLAGYEGGSHFVPGSLDGAINSEEADQEQVLNQHAGSPKEDVVAGLIAMKEMNNAVLLGSLVNMKMEDVILEATPSFYYSRKLNPGSMKDNVPVIGFDDHAYTHIIPKLFRNYDKLKQYDAFCLQYITVESTQLTTNITGTTVSFYPLTKDTRNMDNAVIKSAYNHQDSGAYSRIAYVIRNTTPGTFVNTSTGFYPENFQVLPNGAIRTEFLNKYNAIDTDQDGSFLSYGTLCFVKENLGEEDVAMQFSIKLHFSCWKQQYLAPEDDSDDGSGSQPGSSMPTSSRIFSDNVTLSQNDEMGEEPQSFSPVSNCVKRKPKFNKK